MPSRAAARGWGAVLPHHGQRRAGAVRDGVVDSQAAPVAQLQVGLGDHPASIRWGRDRTASREARWKPAWPC